MSASVLDRRRIHPSLVRPVLFGGAERGVAVVSVAAAVGVTTALTCAVALVNTVHVNGVNRVGVHGARS